MDSAEKTLQRALDHLVPEAADSFYRLHSGFQDPVGVGRRLIAERHAVGPCAEQLLAVHPHLDIGVLVINLLNSVSLLPEPIDTDYTAFRDAPPFPPHLVCYALAYIKDNPEPRFAEPVTLLIVRSGWWAGDENCVDDLLTILPKSRIVTIAADSILHPSSLKSLFAAGQLLYHLRYGEEEGLHGYVKEQYERAARSLTDPDELREVRARLASGLRPWITIWNEKRR